MLAPGSLAEEGEEAAVDQWVGGPMDLSAGSGVGIDMLVPI